MLTDPSETPEPLWQRWWVIAGFVGVLGIAFYFWGARSTATQAQQTKTATSQQPVAPRGSMSINVKPAGAELFIAGIQPPNTGSESKSVYQGKATITKNPPDPTEEMLKNSPPGYYPMAPFYGKRDPSFFSLGNFPIGHYNIRIQLKDYDTYEGEITIGTTPGMMDVALTRSSGRVIIEGSQDAEVWNDDHIVGKTPLTLDKVLTGPVQYTVRKKGFLPVQLSGDVLSGKDLQFQVEMQKWSGSMPNEADTWIIPSIGMKMAWIPPGSYTARMSSMKSTVDSTNSYKIAGFWFGIYEVTQREWMQVVPKNPSQFKSSEHPVENVVWKDVVTFCQRITERERKAGRLPADFEYTVPSLAESVYARRTGESQGYGGDFDAIAWFENNSNYTTHPVGRKRPNAWGLYDTYGNVGELCEDKKPNIGSESHLVDGGTWKSSLNDFHESPGCWSVDENYGNSGTGFRLALKRVTKKQPQNADNEAPRRPNTITRSTPQITKTDETKTGKIELTSEPAGAEVFRGKESLGCTPCRIENLAAGLYRFELKLKDYEPATCNVQVKSNEVSSERVVLNQYFGPKPGVIWTLPELKLTLMWIRAGQFSMGHPGAPRFSDEAPTAVTLTRGYWMGQMEVTQKQWSSVMGTNPSKHEGDDQPVENVSWTQAAYFCQKINENERQAHRLPDGYEYALPTEAQWEFACRGTVADDVYSYDDTSLGAKNPLLIRRPGGPLGSVAWFDKNSDAGTHAAGLKQANGFGLKDMYGNVSEWCRDWYQSHRPASATDPIGTEPKVYRAYRGSNYSQSYQDCLSSRRFNAGPEKAEAYRGFRLSLAPSVAGSASNDNPTEASHSFGYVGPNPGDILRLTDSGLTLIWIPPSQFIMGRPEAPQSSPEKLGYIAIPNGFWLGKTEVSQKQWERVMGDNPSQHKGDDLPVDSISWVEAMAFCQKFTELERKAGRLPNGYEYSLPTEAQWEFACRGGAADDSLTRDDTRAGEADPITVKRQGGKLGDVAWFDKNSNAETHHVGQKKANNLGFQDMYGNVSEWCSDQYQIRKTAQAPDSREPVPGLERAYRGSNLSHPYSESFSARRYHASSEEKSPHRGFRLALSRLN